MSEGVAADVRPLRVLLLEDSRFDAELLREALLRSYPRADLHVVPDEERFTQALEGGGWDVILSDYELPGFSGAQALRIARQTNPYVPFVFVSGVIGEDNAVEMLKRGATDYVSKQRLSRLPVVLERALREVSERRARSHAEARLREADAMYARVVESLRDYAVVLLDRNGRITTWNAAAEAMFGYEAQSVLGEPASMLYLPDDRDSGRMRQRLDAALANGSHSGEYWVQRRDGLHMRADSVVAPVYSDEGEHTGFCAIVRDVTQRYRDAEALRGAKDQAEQANEAKDRFLAVLSHELRTPLTPIVAAAHLLERTAIVPPRQQHLLPMIRRNVALEARLIDDLLDLTAIASGKVHLKRAPVDVHGVVARVVDMLRDPVQEANLTLEQRFDATDPVVHADEARLQQVIWNVVRNAIKFTPAGGTITLRTSSAGGRLQVRCTDTGMGIPAEALGRIFAPFEQADREVAQRLGGLGLGLAIAKGLAEQHEGTLEVESEGAGKGATFILTLDSLHPAAAAGDESAGAEAAAAVRGMRLLLVEDNLDAAATMGELLELYGWEVTHAPTCASALDLARTNVFDAVLTDLGLPDGSGIDVGKELSSTLPVVALSGYGASPDLQRSAMAGFAGHLVKPADPESVHQALQRGVEDYRVRQKTMRQRA